VFTARYDLSSYILQTVFIAVYWLFSLNLFLIHLYIKVKITLQRSTKTMKYNSTLCLILVIDGVSGELYASAVLPPWETRYPLYRRLNRLQGLFKRVRKISHPQGFDPRTVQPVASRYTDWAIIKFRLVYGYNILRRLYHMCIGFTGMGILPFMVCCWKICICGIQVCAA
jgi:hypothetical protein